jgi:hypothetical protein
MAGSRTYPLFLKNSIQFRFDYGVFLLNKDLELLMSKNELKPLDIRQTLPNLKYLLYVLASGSGELPTRKAGGIRGLLVGSISSSPAMSRTNSDDDWDVKASGDESHRARFFSKSKRAAARYGRPAGTAGGEGGGGGRGVGAGHFPKASGLRDVG